MAAVGVDACKRGWVAVVLRDGRPTGVHFLPTIGDIADSVPDADVIAIDIPIGLPDAGRRQADLAAKAMLGERQNSVFMTPVRAALEAPSYAAARAIATELTGVGISQQSFALRSKIFEVEQWLSAAPCSVYEVHPEVSFAIMCGRPSSAYKKSWQGMVERRGALARLGISLDQVDPKVGALVGADDIIDAAAAAWSATRLLAGFARALPDPPEVGPAGRQIAIWA